MFADKFIALTLPVGLKGFDVGTKAGAAVLNPATGTFMAGGAVIGVVGTKLVDGLNSVIFI